MLRRLMLAAVLAGAVLVPAPAHAEARVTIANADGEAAIDPRYATTVRVSGSGFQSVPGGHGGIYVFFGTVEPGWQPSKGGVTGSDYLYVPDSEAKDNQGFQRYVAFPGSDTASSANGGVMRADGTWSTELVVPGAVFRAYGRDGTVRSVDCRTVTCGVITVGAHGIKNARNETFTPVDVRRLQATEAPPGAESTAGPAADASASPDDTGKPAVAGPARLEVDRASAVAGNVLAFAARGLTPGAQVSAVFDDGAAAAGPFAVGPDGRLAGVLPLPPGTSPGTHELRLYGVDDAPSVSFAVRAAELEADEGPVASGAGGGAQAAWLFAGASGLVLVLALARLGVGLLRRRRAAA